LTEELAEKEDSTPESKVFNHATPVRRMWGQTIDALIAIALALGAGYLVKFLSDSEGLGSFVMIILFFSYYLFADGFPNGQSLAKRLLGMKVVHAETEVNCGYWQSCFRNACGFFGVFDWFSILFRSRRRAGDYLANTVVIRITT